MFDFIVFGSLSVVPQAKRLAVEERLQIVLSVFSKGLSRLLCVFMLA